MYSGTKGANIKKISHLLLLQCPCRLLLHLHLFFFFLGGAGGLLISDELVLW